MSLTIKTAPAVDPVSVEDAKTHLRIDHSADDSYIGSLITAALQYVERAETNRALITQTWNYYLEAFPGGDVLELPLPPLQSVTGVYYTPDGDSEATFSSANYTVDTDSEPGRVVLNSNASWPGDELEEVNGVRVEFVAGYGDSATDVPEPLRQAIRLIVAELYENREDVVIGAGNSVVPVPYSSKMLLQNYRHWSFPR